MPLLGQNPPICQVCGCEGERDNLLLHLKSGGDTCLRCANRPAL